LAVHRSAENPKNGRCRNNRNLWGKSDSVFRILNATEYEKNKAKNAGVLMGKALKM
jgi:hypothetical protein